MKRFAGVLLLALISTSALTDVAEARPRHHRHHHHRARIAAPAPTSHSWSGFGGSDVVATARQYVGSGAVFGRATLWCATFMNYVLQKTGHRPTGSDAAASFASKPQTTMHVGAIAVMRRRGGGHVGVVSGIDANGNPIIISGNSRGRKVYEGPIARSRVYKFVDPS
jgi:uncharacterized protein (TIGR02594 family)